MPNNEDLGSVVMTFGEFRQLQGNSAVAGRRWVSHAENEIIKALLACTAYIEERDKPLPGFSASLLEQARAAIRKAEGG